MWKPLEPKMNSRPSTRPRSFVLPFMMLGASNAEYASSFARRACLPRTNSGLRNRRTRRNAQDARSACSIAPISLSQYQKKALRSGKNEIKTGVPLLLSGNEAIAYGALAAGARFYGGYPITPSTEIAEVMAAELPKLGGKFIQMEDEIASLGAVIGASIAGVKSITATSGPGFSLMQEHIGFAAMAEVPCVIVDVMRGGPSTGLADKDLPGRRNAGQVRLARRLSLDRPRPRFGDGVLHADRQGIQPVRKDTGCP